MFQADGTLVRSMTTNYVIQHKDVTNSLWDLFAGAINVGDVDWVGGSFDDKFYFQAKTDSIYNTIDGKGGTDSFFLARDSQFYTFTNYNAVKQSVTVTATATDTKTATTLTSIEQFVFTDKTLTFSQLFEYVLQITGSSGSDILRGNDRNNIINGGDGNDILIGGFGNDIYIVDTNSDTITESTNAGNDTVKSSVTFSLASIANVENLTLIGAAIINGTGNALNNRLNGNTAANQLNGGLGLDTMLGGDGSDTYYIDNIGDVVTETNAIASTGGTDLVNNYLAAYTLGTNVENGRIMATTAANMTGNALNNVIYAGVGNNSMDGLAGTDTLSYQYATTTGAVGVTLNLSALNASGQAKASGISGADLIKGIENIIGSNYNDTLTGNAGNNVLNGLLGADILNGGAGIDILIGGAGKDTLTGGLRNDSFDFDTYSEMGLGLTRDVITDFVRGQDKVDLSTIDPNAALASNQAFTFIASTTAFSVAGQVRYSAGIIAINTDTDAATEYEIQLTGVIPAVLAATDFVL